MFGVLSIVDSLLSGSEASELASEEEIYDLPVDPDLRDMLADIVDYVESGNIEAALDIAALAFGSADEFFDLLVDEHGLDLNYVMMDLGFEDLLQAEDTNNDFADLNKGRVPSAALKMNSNIMAQQFAKAAQLAPGELASRQDLLIVDEQIGLKGEFEPQARPVAEEEIIPPDNLLSVDEILGLPLTTQQQLILLEIRDYTLKADMAAIYSMNLLEDFGGRSGLLETMRNLGYGPTVVGNLGNGLTGYQGPFGILPAHNPSPLVAAEPSPDALAIW